jgi:nitrous oxide reductase accessory protein NosL
MGDELIPFRYKDEAETFSIDHKGFKVLKFRDITEQEVYKLDE